MNQTSFHFYARLYSNVQYFMLQNSHFPILVISHTFFQIFYDHGGDYVAFLMFVISAISDNIQLVQTLPPKWWLWLTNLQKLLNKSAYIKHVLHQQNSQIIFLQEGFWPPIWQTPVSSSGLCVCRIWLLFGKRQTGNFNLCVDCANTKGTSVSLYPVSDLCAPWWGEDNC